MDNCIIYALSVLEQQQFVKNAFCRNEKEWSESYQSQLEVDFFQRHLNKDTIFISIRSVISAMNNGNSNDNPNESRDSWEVRDFWEFYFFIASSKLFTPGSIGDDPIAVKSIIDRNKNFRCDLFVQFLLDEYEKVQPFEVDFGDYAEFIGD